MDSERILTQLKMDGYNIVPSYKNGKVIVTGCMGKNAEEITRVHPNVCSFCIFRAGFWNGRPLKTHIQQLCEALAKFGIWVRLHYVYPYPHVDKVIVLMDERKILPYLDIPFQHGRPQLLKAMKRRAAAENTLERSLCPDITLRSTFIVGFPDETDEYDMWVE